ncbi:MAG: tRNA(Arg) A34 adenosine deaminase TadA [Gammaproteobacteria bacterium]|jgi:tRNA(Arg) A34 adenosine deaminase TadA
MSYNKFLQIARDQAKIGEAKGNALSGALIIKDDKVLATSHDRRHQNNDPIASAAMECIRLAGRRTDQSTLTLISTSYPDMLLAGTMLQFSIGTLVIGQPETSSPAIDMLKSKEVSLHFHPK